MKIFLIDPPMQSNMLAGQAVREGHEVLIYNGEHDPKLDYVNLITYSSNYYRYLDLLQDEIHPSWKKVAAVIREFQPDMVGITAFSVKWPSAKRIAAVAKDCNPQVPVVMGGQHATIMTGDVLSDPNIDFVVRGEGEETLSEFLAQLEGEQKWEDVAGLSFKSNGRVIHNGSRPLISDLDELPFPARH